MGKLPMLRPSREKEGQPSLWFAADTKTEPVLGRMGKLPMLRFAMTTHDDVRRICSKLPGAVEGEGRFGFSVDNKGKAKGFLWSWAERVHPKKARVINDNVIAVVVPSLTAKDLILESGPPWSVDDPHYNGYPAVLVRLDAVEPGELEDLIIEAWRAKAPKDLLKQYEPA